MMNFSVAQRDTFVALALVAILALVFPLIGSLFANPAPSSALIVALTPTLAPTVVAPTTPLPQAYLIPFRQVFAPGQTEPQPLTPFLLYEKGNAPFQVLDTQGALVRIQAADAKTSYWTAAGNLLPTLPEAAQFDYSDAGKAVRLNSGVGYACLETDGPANVFSTCQDRPNASGGQLAAKITSGSMTLYLIEMNGSRYFVPPESVAAIQ